jgi:hypothetical protein
MPGSRALANNPLGRLTSAKESEVAFLGDDLPDLAIMQSVARAVVIHNAHPAPPLHHQSRWPQRRHPRTRRTYPQIQSHLGRNDRQSPRLKNPRGNSISLVTVGYAKSKRGPLAVAAEFQEQDRGTPRCLAHFSLLPCAILRPGRQP